jgi:hypothetical protein
MWQDVIVEEVHRVREAHAAQFNHDLWAIYQDLKRLEVESECPLVSFPPKKLHPRPTQIEYSSVNPV